MKKEYVFGVMIVCLFASTLYVTYEYVKVNRALGIYKSLAMEYWAKEQIEDFLEIDVENVDMIDTFTYKVSLLNGTSLIFKKYEGTWHSLGESQQ